MSQAMVGLIAACRAERQVNELGDEADDWVQDPAAPPGRVYFARKAAARRVRANLDKEQAAAVATRRQNAKQKLDAGAGP
eukprot:1956153-Alexandrium_andersonii.AAC.1